MEVNTFDRRRNPALLIAGAVNGKPFAIVAGESGEELETELQELDASNGADVRIRDSDVYIKLENAVFDYRDGSYKITLPDPHEGLIHPHGYEEG